MSNRFPEIGVEPDYLEQADRAIIEGEKRIGRLLLLIEKLAAHGLETHQVENMVSEHGGMLQSWHERRLRLIERAEMAGSHRTAT